MSFACETEYMSTKVTFLVHYNSTGSEIKVLGDAKQLGNEQLCSAPIMRRTPNSDLYFLETYIPHQTVVKYKYVVVSNGDSVITQSEERILQTNTNAEVTVNNGTLKFSGKLSLQTKKHQLVLALGENSIADRTHCITTTTTDFMCKKFVISLQGKDKRFEIDYPLVNPLQEFVFAVSERKTLDLCIDYFDSTGDIIGKSFVASRSFEDSGKCVWPIISPKTWAVIGHIIVEYLLVIPFSHPMLNGKASGINEGRIFRKSKRTLTMGHRGSGANAAISSEGKFPVLLENTLLSFRNAVSLGSDYIEFDVNMTGDGVPVIFHDFSIPLTVPTNNQTKDVKIPINSLLLEEIKLIGIANQTVSHSKGIQHDSYPTLQELLDTFPNGIGFDVEVKYPGFEESHYNHPKYSRNEMIDKVLEVVFDGLEHSDRDIFFSSFDPECCILLNQKQSKYPVFFLTEGGEALYPSDPRKNSLREAVEFCKRSHLFGVVSPISIFLNNESHPSQVQDEHLLLFTWGKQNNEPKNIATQQQLGMDGIISDHLFNSSIA